MKLLPDWVRQMAIRAGREFFGPRAAARRREWPEDRSGVSVHMVVGHSMLSMGLLALRSWEFHTQRRWRLVIHEDGSFNSADRTDLKKHFPEAQLIERAAADEQVQAALRDFPSCRNHRANHNWFLKVFDTRHFAPGERYIILDSDIVFFRRPARVLEWVDNPSDQMWIMEDEREKYSHARADIEKAMDVRMVGRGNSGLDLMNKRGADLALADKFLAACSANARQYEFLEQTIFSLWVSAWRNGGLLPSDEYEISWNNFRGSRAVCRHYIGPAKNDALFVEGAPVFWWQSRGA
jgi:hypothetical protein